MAFTFEFILGGLAVLSLALLAYARFVLVPRLYAGGPKSSTTENQETERHQWFDANLVEGAQLLEDTVSEGTTEGAGSTVLNPQQLSGDAKSKTGRKVVVVGRPFDLDEGDLVIMPESGVTLPPLKSIQEMTIDLKSGELPTPTKLGKGQKARMGLARVFVARTEAASDTKRIKSESNPVQSRNPRPSTEP